MHSKYETKSTESLLEALIDEERRNVITYLSDASGNVATRTELADYVSEHCPDTRDEAQVAIRLHHVSLPKLAEAGVLEYDPRSEAVRYYPDTKVENLLDYLNREGW